DNRGRLTNGSTASLPISASRAACPGGSLLATSSWVGYNSSLDGDRALSQSPSTGLPLACSVLGKRFPEPLKPSSLIAQSRARRQTQTKEDLEEQNGHKTQAHVPNKDSKVCLPIPCPPSSLGVPLMKRLSSRAARRCVKDMGCLTPGSGGNEEE
ncbi:hypothetical protein JOQ06_014781, partial [Pogonophryne albipinna]